METTDFCAAVTKRLTKTHIGDGLLKRRQVGTKLMKQIQTTLLLMGFACLGPVIQPEEAQAQAAASCTFTTSDLYASVENVSNVLTCNPSSLTGASIASKVLIQPATSSSFNIGFIGADGTTWIRPVGSINIAGTGSCATNIHNNQCTGVSSGDRVSFTDSNLSDFGTLSFVWNGSAAGVQRVGMVTASTSPGNGTREKISSFMQNRAATILSLQPTISGFLDGSRLTGGGSLGKLDLSASSDNMDLAFSSSLSRIRAAQRGRLTANQAAEAMAERPRDIPSVHANAYAAPSKLAGNAPGVSQIDTLVKKPAEQSPSTDLEDRFDIWTEIYAARSKADKSKASMFVGFLGAHYFVTPDMLIGAMVQIDTMEEKNGTSSANGTGWMAGPYLAGRVPGQNLLYEARAAWGQSDNEIRPVGTHKDRFDTERWLVTGQLKGDYALSRIGTATHVTFNPFVRASYFEEQQKAYVNALGSAVNAQTIALGEVEFGPRLSAEMELENGLRIAPSVSTSGIYTFASSNNNGASAAVLKDGDLRARLDASLALQTEENWRLDISSFYDGLGVDDYEAYGGKVRITIPLN